MLGSEYGEFRFGPHSVLALGLEKVYVIGRLSILFEDWSVPRKTLRGTCHMFVPMQKEADVAPV